MFADNIQIIDESDERYLKTENILVSEWSLCGIKTVVFSTYLSLEEYETVDRNLSISLFSIQNYGQHTRD